jgi:hypothetical protein
LTAQSCIDRGISLLTRDRDFRAFHKAVGLSRVVEHIFPLAGKSKKPIKTARYVGTLPGAYSSRAMHSLMHSRMSGASEAELCDGY